MDQVLATAVGDWKFPSQPVRMGFSAPTGPAGTGPRPLSGSVTFHGSDGNIATIDLFANGRFSAHLPVGRYTIAERSPQFKGGVGQCQAPGPVTVTNDVTSRIEIDCQES